MKAKFINEELDVYVDSINENLNEMSVDELAKNELYAFYKKYKKMLGKDVIHVILSDLLEKIKYKIL